MKTFRIAEGDLVVGRGGFEVVEGQRKTRQDLGILMREPYGRDRFHAAWGSLLAEYVGERVSEQNRMLIQGEITRLIRNYAGLQTELLERDAMLSRKAKFTTGEIIAEVEEIEVRQDWDRLSIKVTVRTLSNEEISIARTVLA